MTYLGEYTEVGWQNEPSRATPINAHNLGVMEDGIKRLFYYLLAGGGTGGGSATDGREVELRNNGEYIQWRYSGEEAWINLVSLSDLKGEKGDDYVLTEEDILKIAEKVKIDVPDSAADISFENEGTDLKSTNVQGAIGELSGQNTDRANTLWAIMQKTAFTEQLTDAELNAFKTAWGITDSGEEPDTPEVTLSSISATYSGGSVLVGTPVNALTSIVVKANYSDGTSKTVTGYSLSGTIKEGSNTVTVSYGGKSTTITVIGYVENEPEITLSSISATYTGGNVPVGTTLTDLTGITVTGTYSDGSTSPITGYTLSGTIAEGSNTITVSYGGKTTTFKVTGVAESGGEEKVVNLFDASTMVQSGYFVQDSNGEIKKHSSRQLAFIPVNNSEDTYYSINSSVAVKDWTIGSGRIVFIMDSDKNFIRRYIPYNYTYNDVPGAVETADTSLIRADDGGTGFTILVPQNAGYIVVQGLLNKEPDDFSALMVEVGTTCHDYVEYVG